MAAWLSARSQRSLSIARVAGAVTLGLALVALPTIIALFPYISSLPRSDRWLTLVGWLVVALVAGVVAAVADSELHRKIDDQRAAVVAAEHRGVIASRLAGVPTGVGGIPAQYSATLYAPSPDGAYLIPVFPRVVSLRDPAIFPTGAGATGKAWESNDGAFVVTGSAVASAEHGLTELQQDCYRQFEVAASCVIRDDADQPIGVFSVLGRSNDGFFDDEVGVNVLRERADEVAWITDEATRWMMPMGEELNT